MGLVYWVSLLAHRYTVYHILADINCSATNL